MTETSQPYFNSEDREYLDRLTDEHKRAVVADSLTRYRRADRLAAGDPVPALPLTRLTGGGEVSLPDLVRGRPLVLLFGSYT
ncbi:MAG: hypothetical protein HZB53_03240 [Chloroflexi bacterium]|nr:hypothetical protein [Chloroflexota bacterium]